MELNPSNYILAIDTSTPVCSVALLGGDTLLGNVEMYGEKLHAKILSPLIEDLLKRCEIKYAQLKAVAVASGPGSYTGLRVGLSTAKGIAWAHSTPLYLIPTLDGLAWSIRRIAPPGFMVCPMLDARRNEVYAGLYDVKGEKILDPVAWVLEPDTLPPSFTDLPCCYGGPGAFKATPLIGRNSGDYWVSGIQADAAAIAWLAKEKMLHSAGDDLVHAEPQYLKPYRVTERKPEL